MANSADPAVARARRANVPDGVPLGIQLPVGERQAVDERARRVRREIERAPLIAERVEHDLDAIVGTERRIAHHLRADDAIGLCVVRVHAYVEIVLVAQQRDLGAFAGRAARVGLALDELADLRRRAPGRFARASRRW